MGDALGAPLEFLSAAEIRRRFGPAGLDGYAAAYGRVGAITDDTQMTLFTAEGFIRAANRWATEWLPDGRMRNADRGICNPVAVMGRAYQRRLFTQDPDAGAGIRSIPPVRADGW